MLRMLLAVIKTCLQLVNDQKATGARQEEEIIMGWLSGLHYDTHTATA